MSNLLNNMQLTQWTATDVFNYNELAQNFKLIDEHDHTSNKGVPIPAGGIADGAINSDKLNINAVTSTKIYDGAVTSAKIDSKAITATKIDFSSVNQVTSSLAGAGRTNGEIIYYQPSEVNYIWQLRFTLVNNVNYWYFLGGASAIASNSATVNMADTTQSPNLSTGQDLNLSISSLPAGQYNIRYDGFLNFNYLGDQSKAEFRVKIFNGNTDIGDTVIAPPTQGVSDTQLAVPVTLPLVKTFTSSATLSAKAYTIYRQTSGSITSTVNRQLLTVTPVYLTVL